MNWYLFAAYGVIWTLLFVFLLFLYRKQRGISERLRKVAEEESGQG